MVWSPGVQVKSAEVTAGITAEIAQASTSFIRDRHSQFPGQAALYADCRLWEASNCLLCLGRDRGVCALFSFSANLQL